MPRPFTLGHRFLCLTLALVPPLVLLFAGGRALLERANAVLARATPYVQAEASRALSREVRIGRLSPDLTVGGLWRMARAFPDVGVISVAADNVALANVRTIAGSGTLATANRVSATVSLTGLLAGDTTGFVPRIVVDAPDVLLIRRANNKFNVQDIVPRSKNQSGKPFRTLVEVRNGRVRLRDFAARLDGQALPSRNDLSGINGTIDLSGARSVRFALSARATPGTPTQARLGGRLALRGVVARGTPGARPDAATPGSARSLVSARAGDADAAYWFDYLFDIRTFSVAAGRADVVLDAALPRPAYVGGAPPPIQFSGEASVRNARITTPRLPVPLENAGGTFRFDNGALRFEAAASLGGARARADGTLWDLTRVRAADPPPVPQIAATLRVPAVDTRRVLALLLPRGQSLPGGLRLTGAASLNVAVEGRLVDPVVVGRLQVARVVFRNLPLDNLAADVTYAAGLAGLTNLSGRAAGGTITGRAGYRFAAAAAGPGNERKLLPPGERTLVFSGAVKGADLSRVRDVVPLGAAPRASGRVTVAVVGRVSNAKTTLAANVETERLVVSGIPVPLARGRVIVENNRFFVPQLALFSPAGAVRITGRATEALDLRFTAVGVDAGRFARALLRRRDVGGVLSARGTITGTIARPVVIARELSVLRPAFGAYRADLVRGGVRATREQITLAPGFSVRRFPAEAVVSGTIAGLNRSSGGPSLALSARVANLDFREVLRQAGQTTVNFPVTGLVEQATIDVAGTTRNPIIDGAARLGQINVRGYLVDAGQLRFGFREGAVSLVNARLSASVGTITASARVTRDGRIEGSFDAPNLNLDPLTSLTRQYASVGGKLRVRGTVRGSTRGQIVVSTTVLPSDVSLAGAPFTNLQASTIRFAAGRGTNASSSLTIPLLSFQQGAAGVSVSNARYDAASGAVAGTVSVRDGDIAALVARLRQSGLTDTPAGARVADALKRLPASLGGKITQARIALGGRITGSGVEDPRVSASLSAVDVRIEQFVANQIALEATYNKDVVTLANFSVKNDATDTTILASGTVDLSPGGVCDLSVRSNQISLNLVRAFLPPDRSFPLAGSVDLSARATGPTRTPTVRATLNGNNVVLLRDVPRASVPINVVRIGPIVLAPTPDPSDSGTAGVIDLGENLVLRSEAVPGGQTNESAVRATGTLPFSYQTLGIPAGAPIRVSVVADDQNLVPLLALAIPDLPRQQLGGRLAARLDIGGTTSAPLFAPTSFVRVSNARFALRPPSGGGAGGSAEPFSPITDLNARIEFDGDRIAVPNLSLNLGGGTTSGGAGPAAATPDVVVSGGLTDVDVPGLARLAGARSAAYAAAAAAAARPADGALRTAARSSEADYRRLVAGSEAAGRIDLRIALSDLRPVENNLLGLGEQFRGIFNGTVFVRGALRRPLVTTTPEGQTNPSPLVVRDATFQLPTREGTPAALALPYPIDPRFDVDVRLGERVAVQRPGTFRLEADGRVSLNGSLQAPLVQGNLFTQGGFLQLQLARFVVDKGGGILVRFQPPDFSRFEVSDLSARTTVYPPAGTTPSLSTRLSQGGGLPASTQPAAGGRSTRYRITVTVNGPLELGDTGDERDPQQQRDLRVAYTSDPPLSEAQILALVGNEQQIRLAAQGDVQTALRQGVLQAVNSSLLPTLLSPIEQSVASALGLEGFSVEYSPGLPITFFFEKRLSDPFERVILSYTRTLGGGQASAGTQPGQRDPYEFSVFYDLTELRARRQIRPRLQLGVITDEQRSLTYSLRGTVSY